MYFGAGYYGVEAAARGYFGKARRRPRRRTKPRCSRRSSGPRRSTRRASRRNGRAARRDLVLRLMRRAGTGLSDAEFAAAPSRRSCRTARSGRGRSDAFAERLLPGRSTTPAGGGCSAPTASCAAGCACTRPTIRSCSAQAEHGDSRADRRRSPRAAFGGQGSAGQPGRARSRDRRRSRARRRPRLRREQVQPRDAGASPGRVGVQADHLCGRARARLRARARCCASSTHPIETGEETWLPRRRARRDRGTRCGGR